MEDTNPPIPADSESVDEPTDDRSAFRWTPHDGVTTPAPALAQDISRTDSSLHPWNETPDRKPPYPGPAPFPGPAAAPDRTEFRRPSPGFGDRPSSPFPDTVDRTRRPLPDRPLYHYPADAIREAAPTQQRTSRWATAAITMVAGLLGAGATVGLLWSFGAFDDPPPTETVAAPQVTIVERVRTELVPTNETTSTAVAVARKVVPSIVRVEVGDITGGDFSAFGSGSGVVLTEDGYIVTNQHVVEDSTVVRVVFQDGRIYEAELVGGDTITDLAVLKIDRAGLTPIELGATDSLEIGETAIAVGNPLALSGGASLTVGVLSAFDREVDVGPNDSLYGMLQTDAPITQGSSGGALVDAEGKLIGITTAIGVSSAGAEGIGFAIPVELVVRITDEIVELGFVRHAFLGIFGRSFIDEVADGALVPGGAVIESFAPDGSAAESAGLQAGDRIVAVDGVAVLGMQDLINTLRMYRVGQAAEFEIIRDDERITTTVILEERPPEE